MADRKVTQTGKNEEGDITALCDPGASWSPRAKADAIADIRDGTHRYYVDGVDGEEVDIVVVDDPDGPYLRTSPDGTPANNLDELPDCGGAAPASSSSVGAGQGLKRPPVAPVPPTGRRVG